jgi:hypothetical protein
MLEMEHGESWQLGAQKRRTLRQEKLLENAIEYGQKVLKKRASKESETPDFPRGENGFEYVGKEVISVYVVDENGDIYCVIVKPTPSIAPTIPPPGGDETSQSCSDLSFIGQFLCRMRAWLGSLWK